MGFSRQSLPILIRMSLDCLFPLLFAPFGHGGTELLFGFLRADCEIAGGSQPFGKCFVRRMVKISDQLGFPVVPDIGSDAADIADGQHGQELES